MAFRIEKAIGLAMLLGVAAAAEQAEVRHRHLHGGETGIMRVTQEGIAFDESGKKKEHSRKWAWTDIQQVELRRDSLTILTYEDNKWNSGRDIQYNFDRVPEDFILQIRSTLRYNLRGRLVEMTPRSASAETEWKMPAKLSRAGWRGANGVLTVGPGDVAFQASRPEDSRTWSVADIESVATSGPYDLAITTIERSGFTRASGREFRFNLKEPLDPARYQELWTRVERSKGLQVLNTYKGESK